MRHQTNLYLQIGCEGIREPHVPWEGTEDEVAELDAVGRNDITEAVMIVAQELWEVMQQNQKHSQCTLEPKKNKSVTQKRILEIRGEIVNIVAALQSVCETNIAKGDVQEQQCCHLPYRGFA